MLSVPTTFVIGAGAGKEIDMPIGSELSAEIAAKLNIKHKDYGPELSSGDYRIASALRQISKLKGDDYNTWRAAGCSVASGIEYTRSIDAYLNAHRDNEKLNICGKIAIAQIILEHERASAVHVERGGDFYNSDKVHKSWLSDFLFLLQDRIVRSDNLGDIFRNLCIINFNYDRCIEQFIVHALQHLYQISEAASFQLMRSLRIFHPYGQVGFMPWEQAGRRRVGFGVSDYGDIVGLSSEIRTFNEQLADKDELQAIREEISKSERIVFLGFHFHAQNMDLLKASGPARGGTVNCYASAIHRSEADHALIDSQIRSLLSARGGSWNVQVDRICDCKKLFKEFGATWLR